MFTRSWLMAVPTATIPIAPLASICCRQKGTRFALNVMTGVAAQAAGAKSKHMALEDGCNVCHDVHGTGQPKMFSSPPESMCYDCHDDILETVTTSASQHYPVQTGNCVACHGPHGADFAPLLKSYYPEGFYAPYSEENYALCLSCHDKGAFEFQRTSESTDFRNGDDNIHFVHVNRSTKGRVCRTCHGVHGADQAKLVQSKVAGFGRWEIPIALTTTEVGGNCTVGCHKPKSYDRVHPVRND